MNNFTPQGAVAVANFILSKGIEEGIPISPMKLVKLVYIAHGWTLAVTDAPLLDEQVYAWPYGPVVRSVYFKFREYVSSDIPKLATVAVSKPGGGILNFDFITPFPSLEGETKETVEKVWDLYKGFSAGELSSLTHQPGTPWEQVTRGKKPKEINDIPIPNNLIKEHYREIAAKRNNQQAK